MGAGGDGASRPRDPVSVSFAFFGGLRCFFGDGEAASDPSRSRGIQEADLSDRPDFNPHAAALTLR
jgi:hypothetical protein